MNDPLLAAVAVGLALAYLACGAALAALFGLAEWSTNWILVVLGWPAPVSVAILITVFCATVSLSIARAAIR